MIYTRAKRSQRSPAQVLGIRNRWLAYQVDEAIELFGLEIEAKLSQAKNEKARQRKLERLLSEVDHYVLDVDPTDWTN